MKFNKDKNKVLHLAYGLGCMRLGNKVAERDVRVLGDNKLNMSQQSTAAATGKSWPGLHPHGHY